MNPADLEEAAADRAKYASLDRQAQADIDVTAHFSHCVQVTAALLKHTECPPATIEILGELQMHFDRKLRRAKRDYGIEPTNEYPDIPDIFNGE